ncbi:MAG: hypothetical protein ACKODK_21735 [Opitutaceae bacterium]
MSTFRLSLLLPGLLGLSLPAAEKIPEASLQASRVLVLANAADPDSLSLARHYLAARAVPEANLLAWKMPSGESVAWRDFVGTI